MKKLWMSIGKTVLQAMTIACIVFLFTVSITEIVLRVWNPVMLRIRGDRIVLPRNVELNYENPYHTEKLDSHIKVSYNSLGFRGPNPPLLFDGSLTILAIGGSTTECLFLTDGKTWTDQLTSLLSSSFRLLWMNNAGIDGTSTFGHIQLMKDYVLKIHPKVALFLVGLNDMAIYEPRGKDTQTVISKFMNSYTSPTLRVLAWYSNVAALLLNIQGTQKAVQMGLFNDKIVLPEEYEQASESGKTREELAEIYRASLQGYKERLLQLIRLSRSANIVPIFMTQPMALGEAVDKTTGVDLEHIVVPYITDTHNEITGGEKWRLLELFNDVVRAVGKEEDVYVVDVAQLLPKDTAYYYDLIHYSNSGAEKIAEILAANLCPYIAAQFPSYVTGACPPVDMVK